jgi:hypothetical protein
VYYLTHGRERYIVEYKFTALTLAARERKKGSLKIVETFVDYLQLTFATKTLISEVPQASM